MTLNPDMITSQFFQNSLILFLVFLLGFYLIPASLLYFGFRRWRKEAWASRRIQQRRPSKADIQREIKWSVATLLAFSLFSALLLEAVQAGKTSVYFGLQDYGLLYLPASFFAALVLHDTYFYWIHRFMHLPRVFPFIHKIHHLSVTPTPFAYFSFQPAEMALQFGIFPILIFFLPMHPFTLIAFFSYNVAINIIGHGGFEIIPARWSKLPLLRLSNNVSHHDLHHTRFHYNFGLYFNFWDRLMGTFLDQVEKKET